MQYNVDITTCFALYETEYCQNHKEYNNALCEDRDCIFNIESRCHNITTVKDNVPDGMYSCSGAVYNFKKKI